MWLKMEVWLLKSELVWLKFWLPSLKVEYVAEDAGLVFEKRTRFDQSLAAGLKS